ncbi:MAG: glycosyltransferase involved in cell wall biosynthesis [Bradymonadia bacterium]|jgi:glycosyltransferase involved in cell wall biosynthesis
MAAPLHSAPPALLHVSDSIDLSIVMAVFNERDSLPQLVDEIVAAMDALAYRWEAIFVDDGSNDGSREYEVDVCARDSRFRAIHFRRNFGKAAALAEGFAYARGRLIVTMDADLQDDPAFISQMVAPIEADETDLVSGWKYPRLDPLTKTIPSKIYNFFTRLATGVHLHDMNCGFKAYRAEVVQELDLYGDMHRYIPVLARGAGFRLSEVKTTHRPRVHGHSKYAFKRFIHGFLDLGTVVFLTRYRRRPLHFIGVMSLVMGGLGFSVLSYLTVLWFLGQPLSNRPLIFLGMLLILLSVQFMTFGLLAEMMTYDSQRGRRDYSVSKRVGFAADPAGSRPAYGRGNETPQVNA